MPQERYRKQQDESLPPINLDGPIKLRIPLPYLISIVGFLIAVGVGWANIQSALNDSRARTEILEKRVDNDHELLVEIRTDVKRLLRKENP